MSTGARQALAELVAVDDLKRSHAQACRHAANFDSAENYQVIDALATEIGKRQPLAWAAARTALAAQPATVAAQQVAKPLDDWDESDSYVLWWRFPIDEPPYVGHPNCDDWPGYHTHWTPLALPTDPHKAAA